MLGNMLIEISCLVSNLILQSVHYVHSVLTVALEFQRSSIVLNQTLPLCSHWKWRWQHTTTIVALQKYPPTILPTRLVPPVSRVIKLRHQQRFSLPWLQNLKIHWCLRPLQLRSQDADP